MCPAVGRYHLDALDREWSGYSGLEIAGTLQAAVEIEIGVRVDLNGPGNQSFAGWRLDAARNERDSGLLEQGRPGSACALTCGLPSCQPLCSTAGDPSTALDTHENHSSVAEDTAIPAASSTKIIPPVGLQRSMRNQ